MKTRILIIFGIILLLPLQLIFAQLEPDPEYLVPDPTPEQISKFTGKQNCGIGTELIDGICFVNKIEKESTTETSEKWVSTYFPIGHADDLIIAQGCILTHTWNPESQRCDVMWNSMYVVESIITVFFIIVISVIIIVYYWRKRK